MKPERDKRVIVCAVKPDGEYLCGSTDFRIEISGRRMQLVCTKCGNTIDVELNSPLTLNSQSGLTIQSKSRISEGA
jgi:hypothetical protein